MIPNSITQASDQVNLHLSAYGNVDIRSGLPEGVSHISSDDYDGVKVGLICKRIGCPSAPAMVGFERSYGRWKPIIDGIVVPDTCYERLMNEISDKLLAREAKALRPRRDPIATLVRRYGIPRNALCDAAAAMLDLNRHAKGCSKWQRFEIYGLKNRFIRLLYEDGRCTSLQRHLLDVPGKQCWRCNGYGCERCDDTGWYREAETLVYYVFAFDVGGVRYVWHQPADSINYPIVVTMPDAPMPELSPKPLEKWARQITRAKRLVEWVVDNWEPNAAGVREPGVLLPTG